MPTITNTTISGGITVLAPPPPLGGSLVYFFNLLTYSNQSDFDMGTGDFTIECYTFITNSTYGGLFNKGLWADVTSNLFRLGGPSGLITSIGVSNYLNVWVHWAITRANNELRIFQNGTRIGAILSNSTNFTSSDNLSIGGSPDINFVGRLTQFNWVKGTALYTSNFTPPAFPITPNANTKLLLLVKTDPTKFVDSSGLNKVPISAGGITFSSSNPFNY